MSDVPKAVTDLIEAFRGRGIDLIFDDAHAEALKITAGNDVLYVPKNDWHANTREVCDRLRGLYERLRLEI